MKFRSRTVDGQIYLSQREAAKRLGVCQATMSRLVQRGDLSVLKLRNVKSVWVSQEDVEKIKRGE
jgi:excisionase family DNA binding protein